jgi:hypothetical protein
MPATRDLTSLGADSTSSSSHTSCRYTRQSKEAVRRLTTKGRSVENWGHPSQACFKQSCILVHCCVHQGLQSQAMIAPDAQLAHHRAVGPAATDRSSCAPRPYLCARHDVVYRCCLCSLSRGLVGAGPGNACHRKVPAGTSCCLLVVLLALMLAPACCRGGQVKGLSHHGINLNSRHSSSDGSLRICYTTHVVSDHPHETSIIFPRELERCRAGAV